MALNTCLLFYHAMPYYILPCLLDTGLGWFASDLPSAAFAMFDCMFHYLKPCCILSQMYHAIWYTALFYLSRTSYITCFTFCYTFYYLPFLTLPFFAFHCRFLPFFAFSYLSLPFNTFSYLTFLCLF